MLEDKEMQEDRLKKIGRLNEELSRQREIADVARNNIRNTIQELAKEQISVVVPGEVAINASRKMGPMDDIFFNKMSEDPDAIGEVISTVLRIPVIVRDVVPQYTIAGIGNRGVRLDAFALAIPEYTVAAELGEDCWLGDKGALINIEVQRSDNDDHEYRVFYNGASIIINNTPKGTKKFRDIQRAVVIFISDFDVFGEGEMYYEVRKYTAKSMTPRRSPVTEIYINTACEDRSSERMEKIADLLKVFKDPDLYDYDRFPKFSSRKHELKETEKGVMELSKELQQVIDNEKAESARIAREEGREEGRAEGRTEITGLMKFLLKNGRGDDAIKASEDESFLQKLLADFRRGMMVAK